MWINPLRFVALAWPASFSSFSSLLISLSIFNEARSLQDSLLLKIDFDIRESVRNLLWVCEFLKPSPLKLGSRDRVEPLSKLTNSAPELHLLLPAEVTANLIVLPYLRGDLCA